MSKNKRARSRGEPDAPDKILRDVSRRHPLELAGAWMNDKPIRSASWAETQFSVRERRMDRLLRVESSDEYRFLHVEWSLRLTPKARRRIFQYHQLGTLTAEIDAHALSTKEKRVAPLPIKSILVVLTGPDKPLPNRGRYATSWPADEFTGMTYRIEAMYQKTMREIAAMGDAFWLIFTPLAIDVTRKKLLGILDQLGARTNPDDFVELVAAMSSMVLEIGSATDEQSHTSEDVAKRVEEVSREIGQNAAATHQMSATVQEIARTASSLAMVSEELSAAMRMFKV